MHNGAVRINLPRMDGIDKKATIKCVFVCVCGCGCVCVGVCVGRGNECLNAKLADNDTQSSHAESRDVALHYTCSVQ